MGQKQATDEFFPSTVVRDDVKEVGKYGFRRENKCPSPILTVPIRS
jgi:hypothetical protein